jgi:hypothetical protein
MAEPSGPGRHRSASEEVDESREAFDAERVLARILAIGLPLLCVGSAVVVGFAVGIGPAILVVAFGALVGTISLLWASLRTLSGDAPLPSGLERSASQSQGPSATSERKRRLLRALKDLESEHAIGKIDDADYSTISGLYREEAKNVMRELDEEVAPSRAEAEKLVLEYMAKRGAAPKAEPRRSRESRPSERVVCEACTTSNEPDATFCKQCGAPIAAGEDRAHAAK